MLVNTEWGAFGDNGELDFIITKWDKNVDEMSVNPGKQVSSSQLVNYFAVLRLSSFLFKIFEKMISGMYMGELIRQVLVDLMKDDLIFFGCERDKLLERGEFIRNIFSPSTPVQLCSG